MTGIAAIGFLLGLGGSACGAGKKGAMPTFDLSSYFPDWLQRSVFGVEAWQIIASFSLVLCGLILKKASDFVFAKKIIPLLLLI